MARREKEGTTPIRDSQLAVYSMNQNDAYFTLHIPVSLIPGLRDLNGPILLYTDKLQVIDGFALRSDEFVTSLATLGEACTLTGVTPESQAIITTRV